MEQRKDVKDDGKTLIEKMSKTTVGNHEVTTDTKTKATEEFIIEHKYISPSNLEAFNSRDDGLDMWTDFVFQEFILQGEIVKEETTGDIFCCRY